jgi:hypothetical protein
MKERLINSIKINQSDKKMEIIKTYRHKTIEEREIKTVKESDTKNPRGYMEGAKQKAARRRESKTTARSIRTM